MDPDRDDNHIKQQAYSPFPTMEPRWKYNETISCDLIHINPFLSESYSGMDYSPYEGRSEVEDEYEQLNDFMIL